MHTVIKTPKAPAAIGPNSQAIGAGNLVFVSGQLGLDPDAGEMKGQDMADQASQALTNLKVVLCKPPIATCTM